MNNITIIIPVHKFDETISGYLEKAIESIEKQQDCIDKPSVMIVSPTGIYDIIFEKFKEKDITFLMNKGESNYQSQVNLAVDNITTDYFSVLEFDDELGLVYVKNVEKYIKSYPDVDIFLSMMIEVNNKNEGVKLTNETVWAQQFVGENGEMGYLNLNALKQYTDFKTSGAVIKKSEFINIGKYKTKIELAFAYEFLLRALNNACKIYTIPKIGYKHLADRVDSLFDGYLKNMGMEERKFWFDTASKESMFFNDRDIDMSKFKK